MKSWIFVLTVGVALLLGAGACKDKEEYAPPVSSPPSQLPQKSQPHIDVVVPKKEIKVVVPNFVKGKWKSVKLEMMNKTSAKSQTLIIGLHSEYTVPDTDLKIKIGDFLPDFKMDSLTITSASEKPLNPAVYIAIYEKNKEMFQGWIYSKFPTIHPFEHEKYSISLIEGIT